MRPPDDKDTGDLDPAAAELASWPPSKLAAYLAGAAKGLLRLEEGAAVAGERRSLLQELRRTLAPIRFVQEEPREAVVATLRKVAQQPGLLASAARCCFDGLTSPLNGEAAATLLEILAEAGGGDSEMLAFDLVARPAILAAPAETADRVQTALVYLAANGGVVSALALADRLRRRPGLHPLAAAAILRAAASRQPSYLTLAFRRLRADLEVGEAPERWLAPVVMDVLRRAGGDALLHTLAALPPREHPALLRAAFSGNAPPFQLVWTDPYTDYEELRIRWSADGEDLESPASTLTENETWHLDLCEVTGARLAQEAVRTPNVDDLMRRFGPVDEPQRAEAAPSTGVISAKAQRLLA